MVMLKLRQKDLELEFEDRMAAFLSENCTNADGGDFYSERYCVNRKSPTNRYASST